MNRRDFIGGCAAGVVAAGLPAQPTSKELMAAYDALPKRRRYDWLTHLSVGDKTWPLTRPMRIWIDEPIDKAEGDRLLSEMMRRIRRREKRGAKLWSSIPRDTHRIVSQP